MSGKPKFSILCPAYNHEKYIAYFIESVLAQTFSDFELIIVDDCSTDKTLEIAKSYNDSRIKIFTKDYNKGVNDSLNFAFNKSQGDFCIFIASDDILEKDYLESIHEIFEKKQDIGVIYCSLKMIDNYNNVYKNQPSWCILKPKERFLLLNELFMIWNTLLSPGLAVRRNVFEQIMPLELSLVNHQDYTIHVKLLLRTNPAFLTTPKVLYRYNLHGKSLSSRNNSAIMREKLEMNSLMNNFLEINNLELLQKIFPQSAENFKNEKLIPFYLAQEALKAKNYEKQQWGYHTIVEFLKIESNFDLLKKELNFTFADYLKISSMLDDGNKTELYRKKYIKYKKYFKNLLLVTCFIFVLFFFIIIGIL